MVNVKPNLLVVEDDVDIAEMLAAYFQAQEYSVHAVNWGEQAVEYTRNYHPDLILLDIRLPDIDGFEVASRLRNNRRTADIPIIFLTDKRTRASRLKGLELGADDYITKPFDVQELRLRVRNSLKRASEGPLTNPVTGLPEGSLVDERLARCLGNPNDGVLAVTLDNLENFREAYGFIAADDVQRALSLMIRDILRESGSQNDFLGQMNSTTFIIVAASTNLHLLTERFQNQLEQSLDYFYPLKDREQGVIPARLSIQIARIESSNSKIRSVQDIKAQLAIMRG
jgi:DNA-binding response OmpR family regulator